MPAETVVFTLRRVARVQKIQALRHVGIGLVLAWSGARALLDGHHASWVDVVAIVSGALLLAAFARERRQASHGHVSHGIGWVDVFASAVTLVEALHLAHQGKKGLPFAYGLLALLLLLIGLFHARLKGVRRLIVDEQGFDIRLMPWRRVRAAWSDVAAVDAAGGLVTVTRRDGQRHRIDLADSPEGDQVIATWLRYAPESRSAAAADALAAEDGMITDPDLQTLPPP